MNSRKLMLLRMLDEAGGSTTEYPFIETGQVRWLDELVAEGLLIRIARAGDLDDVCITTAGRELLKNETTTSE